MKLRITYEVEIDIPEDELDAVDDAPLDYLDDPRAEFIRADIEELKARAMGNYIYAGGNLAQSDLNTLKLMFRNKSEDES